MEIRIDIPDAFKKKGSENAYIEIKSESFLYISMQKDNAGIQTKAGTTEGKRLAPYLNRIIDVLREMVKEGII